MRSYLPSDRARLIEVFRMNTPGYFDPDEESHLEAYLDAHAQTYFTIEHDRGIVGGAGYHFSDEDTVGHISWIFFHPDFSGKGLGTMVVQQCLDAMKRTPTLQRLSVRTSQLAYRFFEKFGFQVVKTERNYWGKGLDLCEMEIILF